MSQIINLGSGGGGGSSVLTLTGNSGGPVPPTAGNINLLGSGTITVTGNPGTSTLTISESGTVATTYDADSGSATPAANILNILGSNGITTSGAGNTITVALAIPVSIAHGGTNATSFATTDGTVYYDGTRLVTTATGTSGFVLTSAGPGVAPSYQAVSASGAVTSVSGGNNITITGTATAPIVNVSGTSNHAVQIGNGTGSLTSIAIGTTGEVLTGVTGADPVWASPASSSITINGDAGGPDIGTSFTFTGGASGAVFTTDGVSTITESFNFLSLPATTSTDGQILISAVPYLHAGPSGISTFLGGAGNFTGDSGYNIAAGLGTMFSMTSAQGNVVLGGGSAGGAGSLTSGSQNIIIGKDSLTGDNYTNENDNFLINSAGVVADNKVIRIFSDGGASGATKCFIGGIDAVNIGSVANVVTVDSSNQLGSAAITAGTGISVTPGANSITIAATGSSSFAWSVITANQTAAVNNGYFCNKAGTLTLALPAASAVGDVIEVANINTASGTQFTQAAGQQIFFASTSTTSGATGTLTSSVVGDTLKIVCRAANTTWQVTSAIGNWSVV